MTSSRSPKIIQTRADLKAALAALRADRSQLRVGRAGVTTGFVPTMGALHVGHEALLRKSASENDITVLSIFVNPKQFGPNEDYALYPRTFANDVALAGNAGVDIVFAPNVDDLYPAGFSTLVTLPEPSKVMCGAFRDGHFAGVATVVLLLLNLVKPDRAYFGLKDFQQVAIIRRMCEDLAAFSPETIVGVPTVREKTGGLALSSRNRYLDESGLALAQFVPKALAASARLFLAGENDAALLKKAACDVLAGAGLEPQYLDLRRTSDLREVQAATETSAVLALAQFIVNSSAEKRTTRLIDNVVFGNSAEERSALEDFIQLV